MCQASSWSPSLGLPHSPRLFRSLKFEFFKILIYRFEARGAGDSVESILQTLAGAIISPIAGTFEILYQLQTFKLRALLKSIYWPPLG